MNVDELIVKKGDPVLPAWKRLLEWVRGLKVMTGPGIRLNVTPQGVVAIVERDASLWSHPWKASAGEVAFVRPGLVRGIPARIKDYRTGKLRRLDGREDDGSVSDEGPPELKLNLKKFDDEGKFWLAVRVKLDGDGNLDPEDPEAVLVSQETTEPPDGHGLALVYLDAARQSVAETFQVCHHNLDFALTRDVERGLRRFIFFPV